MRVYHQNLVSCETLFENLEDPAWVVFDCRHDLNSPQAGPHEFAKGHIPGAIHAHIDRDLSGPVGMGAKGRHPLPIAGAFRRFLSQAGVTQESQVVAYDDAGGAWAARLWWLLRHYGHENVAVLDGGLPRWKSLGLEVSKEHRRNRTGSFKGEPGAMPTIDADALQENLDEVLLVDARAPERFRGDVEPIDPVAGHIPGAINAPFAGNLAPDGLFLSPDELRARYESSLGRSDAQGVTCYCGSGVTAAHDVLAMEIAGMGTATLYPGSWSQWCRPDSGRPVEVGEPNVTA